MSHDVILPEVAQVSVKPEDAKQQKLSMVLAIDGGERLAKEWMSLSTGYITAIIKQLGVLYPTATLEIATMVINNLPPTSTRPLVVRPFQSAATVLATLPLLLSNAKGKMRESTSGEDYALLEGMVVATTMLEARKCSASYLVVASAQDIPNSNFWDEDPPYALPSATLWPEVLDASEEARDTFFSDAWRALLNQLTELRAHLCTVSTRYLPKLEEFQKQVTLCQGYSTQKLPNPQNPEHAILLNGFGNATSQSNKRPHSDSTPSYYPVPTTVNGDTPQDTGQHLNKRIKRSPGVAMAETVSLLQPGQAEVALQQQSLQLQQEAPTLVQQQAYQEQSLQQQAQSASNTSSNQTLSNQEIEAKRAEVKSQMKKFMQHLAEMAKTQQITVEKAKATADKVRTEAMKKLQLLDILEQKQNVLQNAPQNTFQSPYQNNTATLPILDSGQPPLIPSSADPAPAQVRPQGHSRQSSLTTPQQQSTPLHPQQQQLHPQDQQYQSNSITLQRQPSQQQNTPLLPDSPQKGGPPIWSGPMQWSLVDPVQKSKRDLAFYVDAIPIRANAAVELMNVQWPSTMEITSISPMPMHELQKYAQDNKIQVIHFVKASASVVESTMGMSGQQNDTLYQLLTKNLESKNSVGVVKLPGVNRGIVVVALPGQNKLVGLIFLTTPLPPKTPGSSNSRQANPMQQQQQQAYQQLQQQQQQPQAPPAISKAMQQQQSNQQQQQYPNYPLAQQPPPAVMPNQQYNYNLPQGQSQQFMALQQNSTSVPAPGGSTFTDAQFQEMLAQMQKAQQQS